MKVSTDNGVVVAMCLLGDNDFQRFKDCGLVSGNYADYIQDFYCLQADANTKGYKVVVLVFSEASFSEFLEKFKSVFVSQYGHEPVTEAEYAQARAR